MGITRHLTKNNNKEKKKKNKHKQKTQTKNTKQTNQSTTATKNAQNHICDVKACIYKTEFKGCCGQVSDCCQVLCRMMTTPGANFEDICIRMYMFKKKCSPVV